MSVPHAVLMLVLLGELVGSSDAGDHLARLGPLVRAGRERVGHSSGNGCMLSQMPFSAMSCAVASSIRWPCSMHFTPAAIERWIAAGV